YALTLEIQQALQRSLPDVRSTPLGERTLPDALARESERFTREVGIECRFLYVGHLPPLRPAVAEYLLRIAQEALGQMHHDPTARALTVELGHDGASIFLQIAGDGAGFNPQEGEESAAHAWGLQSLRTRAEQLGGSLQFSSEPGRGTTIEVR